MRRIAIHIIIGSALLGIGLFAGLHIGFAQGSLLKGLAIAVLVDKNANGINRAINSTLGGRNLAPNTDTKVVPILSVGQGGYVGAAQVAGPTDTLNQVRAVLQVEGRLGGSFRFNGLVPVNSRSLTNVSRVNGTGVSAVIDVKL